MWMIGGRGLKGLCGQEASSSLQPVGLGQDLRDPSCRCLGELRPRALPGHAWKGAAGHSKWGAGGGASSSRVCVWPP